MGDAKSLAHKYRRQVFYGEKRRAVGDIWRKLCEWKNVKILEAECCPNHIHMLLEISQKISLSIFIEYLKSKSNLVLYEQFDDLKFKYRSREFWCHGLYCGYHRQEYCKNSRPYEEELDRDKLGDQLSLPYPASPFTGRK